LIAAIGNAPLGKYRTMSTSSGDFVGDYARYMEWLSGFVSGFNAERLSEQERQVTTIDPAGMDLWMRNWCNKHPTQTVAQGAVAFITEMLTNAARKQ
jgi:hypothetical protein